MRCAAWARDLFRLVIASASVLLACLATAAAEAPPTASSPTPGRLYKSIQVGAGPLVELQAKLPSLERFPFPRIEKRSGTYVLRVGYWKTEEEAQPTLGEVRRLHPAAFVRDAGYRPDEIVSVVGPPASASKSAPVARAQPAVETPEVAPPVAAAPAPESKPPVPPDPPLGTPYREATWLRTHVPLNLASTQLNAEVTWVLVNLSATTSPDKVDGLLGKVLMERCQERPSQTLQQRMLEAEAGVRAADKGLRFEAGVRADPMADEALRRGGTYAGVSWDLLRDGLRDNQRQADILRREAEIGRLRGQQEESRLLQGCRQSAIIDRLSSAKLRILRLAERFLSTQRKLVADGYFQGDGYLDDLVRVDRDLGRLAQKMEAHLNFALHRGPSRSDAADTSEPVLLDLNLERIIDAVRNDPTYERIVALEREIIDRRQDDSLDSRLRLYFRWNADQNDAVNGFGVGFAYSTPFFLDRRERNAVERVLPKARQDELRDLRVDETLRQYYEYKTALDDGVKLHFRREEVLERLRRSLTAAYLEPDNPAAAVAMLQGVHDLLDTQYEILDNKQRLYIKLVQVLSVAGQPYREEFVAPVGFEQPHDRGRRGERAIYLWSKGFNQHDNRFIISAMQAKKLRTAMISASSRADAGKVNAFLTLARSAGIRVELVAGDVAWLQPHRRADALRHIERLFQVANHVHLDIEPQTLPDYKQQRSQHIDALVSLFQEISRIKGPGQTLSAALSAHLERSEIDRLAAPLDAVYVMAYENPRVDTLVRWLQPYVATARAKVVIALRPQDFGSEAALERAIGELARQLGVERFALHDFDQLLSIAK